MLHNIFKFLLLVSLPCLLACSAQKSSEPDKVCPYKQLKNKCEAGCEKSCNKLEELKPKCKKANNQVPGESFYDSL